MVRSVKYLSWIFSDDGRYGAITLMNTFRLLFQKIVRPPPHFSPLYITARKKRLNKKRAGAHSNSAFCLSGENRVLSKLNRPLSKLNRPLSELNRPCRSWVDPLSELSFVGWNSAFAKLYHQRPTNVVWGSRTQLCTRGSCLHSIKFPGYELENGFKRLIQLE